MRKGFVDSDHRGVVQVERRRRSPRRLKLLVGVDSVPAGPEKPKGIS